MTGACPHADRTTADPQPVNGRTPRFGILGESPAIRDLIAETAIVAPSSATVLIAGETGTGKELVARAIHAQSPRAAGPFVAVNCAALPEALVESELFGHERGAFTGAIARKPGCFELADGGTLFLDEVGDLPLDAQPKLLRVLQDRAVQRIGGVEPTHVDIRVIAATNQELAALTGDGRFRADLYYRLCVFPIHVPPLRYRRDDIEVLAKHFVDHFARRHGKGVLHLTRDAVDALARYDWPGNVRQLQNVIERAVILASSMMIGGALVDVQRLPPQATPAQPLPQPGERQRPLPAADVSPLFETEREAICQALDISGWRISGPRGAADLLKLKPTTLHAKMKKLGIHRPHLRRTNALDIPGAA